jgi:hypothetical protein
MRKTTALFVLFAGLALGSCSREDVTSPEVSSSASGRLRVYLVDAPAAYEAVNISVVRVEVHRESSDSTAGWYVLNTLPGTYDLLKLRNGAQVVLGDTMLPPGSYSQIRLIIGDGSNIVVNGSSHPLEIPSGPQTGLKLIHSFVIVPYALYEVIVDFDAGRSIVVTGNGRYKLKPVLRAQARQISGDIEGSILPAVARSTVTTAVGLDTVSTNADTTTGYFRVRALPEGSYVLWISPADTATYRDTTVAGVTVTRGQLTNVGTINLTRK